MFHLSKNYEAELRNIKREITEVVVHWSETPTNKNIGSEEINETHLANELNGIGYHYVIRRDGSLQRGRPANIVVNMCDCEQSQSEKYWYRICWWYKCS